MTSRVYTAQELTLLQVNAEQSCHATAGAAIVTAAGVAGRAPGRTLYVRSLPATRTQTPTTTATVGAVDATAPSLLSASFTQPSPGGSSSTVAANIVRPRIRARSTWNDVLRREVAPFTLPSRCVRTDAARPVVVRYSADVHDREWLRRRAVCAVDAVTRAIAITTAPPLPTTTTTTTAQTGATATSSSSTTMCAHGVSALEAVISALEALAFDYPEVPLHRLRARDAAQRTARWHTTDAFVEHVKEYWLRKRRALGGGMPCIAELRGVVSDDNEHTLCHVDTLGDCPLPFKTRDWSAPVLCRAMGAAKTTTTTAPHTTTTTTTTTATTPPCVGSAALSAASGAVKRARDHNDDDDGSYNRVGGDEDDDEAGVVCTSWSGYEGVVASALRLSRRVLRREQLCLQHTCMTIYELALLRQLGGPPTHADGDDAVATTDEHGQDGGTASRTATAASRARVRVVRSLSANTSTTRPQQDDVVLDAPALLQALHGCRS